MEVMNISLALTFALPIFAAASEQQRRRSLRADNIIGLQRSISDGIATYDDELGIPSCGLQGSLCDTGNLIIGRGDVFPEPNYPNSLNANCFDGRSGGPTDESVDRIVVSSDSGGVLIEEENARITATVNCYADSYTNDYVYFFYTTLNENAGDLDWNFIERVQCTGGGEQILSTSYTLPIGLNHAVRVSIRHIDDLTKNNDSCGVGQFDDNDDVAFIVAASKSTPNSPTYTPSALPATFNPSTSNEETQSLTPSHQKTFSPSESSQPTLQPTMRPSVSKYPTSVPIPSPSVPILPTLTPTKSPFILFTYGESLYTDHELGIQISVGLTAKRIAKSKTNVNYTNGEHSSTHYHSMMDGAGISLLPDGGYVYLSNAEVENNGGGVYGLYFNKDREIIDYKTLLTGTSRNCGGGMSPWNTWISCEEVGSGQCWQVEPNPGSPNHNSPNVTLLGGSNGGAYESVAVDNTNKNNPIFFVTEDKGNGELRRFEADGNGWDALHEGGQTTYLEFLDGNRFQWTSNLADGKSSAANHYPNAEGIIYHNSTLYFVAKVSRRLFILDLEAMTYTSERTGSSWVGQGSFNSQPDQIIESDLDTRKFIYFTEDGGNSPGVHVRDREGNYYTMVRGIPGGRYKGDETVGIAFSPDRRAFYFGFQDAGVLMEVTRDDGHKFN